MEEELIILLANLAATIGCLYLLLEIYFRIRKRK